jgi:hypothetical protein
MKVVLPIVLFIAIAAVGVAFIKKEKEPVDPLAKIIFIHDYFSISIRDISLE